MGKHSGGHAVVRAYADLGIQLTTGQVESLLPLVRGHAIRNKRPPDDPDLYRFYRMLDPAALQQARRRVLKRTKKED